MSEPPRDAPFTTARGPTTATGGRRRVFVAAPVGSTSLARRSRRPRGEPEPRGERRHERGRNARPFCSSARFADCVRRRWSKGILVAQSAGLPFAAIVSSPWRLLARRVRLSPQMFGDAAKVIVFDAVDERGFGFIRLRYVGTHAGVRRRLRRDFRSLSFPSSSEPSLVTPRPNSA